MPQPRQGTPAGSSDGTGRDRVAAILEQAEAIERDGIALQERKAANRDACRMLDATGVLTAEESAYVKKVYPIHHRKPKAETATTAAS